MGDSCPHGQTEGDPDNTRHPLKPKFERKPCVKFTDNGTCEWGEKCHFTHTPAAPAVEDTAFRPLPLQPRRVEPRVTVEMTEDCLPGAPLSAEMEPEPFRDPGDVGLAPEPLPPRPLDPYTTPPPRGQPVVGQPTANFTITSVNQLAGIESKTERELDGSELGPSGVQVSSPGTSISSYERPPVDDSNSNPLVASAFAGTALNINIDMDNPGVLSSASISIPSTSQNETAFDLTDVSTYSVGSPGMATPALITAMDANIAASAVARLPATPKSNTKRQKRSSSAPPEATSINTRSMSKLLGSQSHPPRIEEWVNAHITSEDGKQLKTKGITK